MLLSVPQVLKDGTTLADNKVGENGFLVVMVQKVTLFCLCFVLSQCWEDCNAH